MAKLYVFIVDAAAHSTAEPMTLSLSESRDERINFFLYIHKFIYLIFVNWFGPQHFSLYLYLSFIQDARHVLHAGNVFHSARLLCLCNV